KPAPTWVMYYPQNLRLAQIPCGSGLAREGGVSVTESLTEPPLSQASQLPHLICFANSHASASRTRHFYPREKKYTKR
ncbi:hypothetical protein, partial [Pseudomonas sp. AU8050]|uniref:hypothetical protein n=1 Tax=Pseudomonas sp. AU8050 TaxID=2681497 RepID=UPI001C49BA36